MKLTLQLLLELAAMERRVNDLYDMAYANYPQRKLISMAIKQEKINIIAQFLLKIEEI